jgi:hypothetical protein
MEKSKTENVIFTASKAGQRRAHIKLHFRNAIEHANFSCKKHYESSAAYHT